MTWVDRNSAAVSALIKKNTQLLLARYRRYNKASRVHFAKILHTDLKREEFDNTSSF